MDQFMHVFKKAYFFFWLLITETNICFFMKKFLNKLHIHSIVTDCRWCFSNTGQVIASLRRKNGHLYINMQLHTKTLPRHNFSKKNVVFEAYSVRLSCKVHKTILIVPIFQRKVIYLVLNWKQNRKERYTLQMRTIDELPTCTLPGTEVHIAPCGGLMKQ